MTNPAVIASNSVPILLLPPSEGKAIGGTGAGWEPEAGSFAALAPRRAEVVEALAAAGGGDRRLLGVSGHHLDRAQSANLSLIGSPTLPAWRRYTGVVWEHLGPVTLPAAARRRIVVVSGLLGLVRGDDPVPDYRLKMGANLPPLGTLSRWWHDALGDALGRRARRQVIVDLLPREHRAAWTPTPATRGVYVDLVTADGRPGAHAAKAAKGSLARAILLEGPSALTTWRHERFEVRTSAFDG